MFNSLRRFTNLVPVRNLISIVCRISFVWNSTVALECLADLERKGLVERVPDPLGERRFSLVLTDRAALAFTEYFASVPRGAVV